MFFKLKSRCNSREVAAAAAESEAFLPGLPSSLETV